MEYRAIAPEDFDTGMNIGWYADLREYNKALDMFQLYPDLFVGCYRDGELVGICYGWPALYVHRSENVKMDLHIISIVPELRKQGYGSKMLEAWEHAVRRRGTWTVGLGSGADMFYVKNGYTPIEYCIRTHKCNVDMEQIMSVPDLSFVMREHDPIYNLYFKVNGKYNAEKYKELYDQYKAVSSCTIFSKDIG